MAKFNKQTYDVVRRLQNARLSLLMHQPFFAVLLMHLKFALDLSCETAYTDGERIAFNPDFMEQLSDRELEFVLMHEVLHAALGHPFRMKETYEPALYDRACDIVVNSNILRCFNGDLNRITLKPFGTAMHRTPDGTEGHELSVEQVYALLAKHTKPPTTPSPDSNKKTEDGNDGNDSNDGNDGNDGDDGDQSDNGGESDDGGKGGKGGKAADGKGGKGGKSRGSAEADLEALISAIQQKSQALRTVKALQKEEALRKAEEARQHADRPLDDHSFWSGDDRHGTMGEIWLQRLIETTELIQSSKALRIDKGSSSFGSVPLCAERILSEIKKPRLDWRTILNDFVQEEICDYSFSPPDRRLQDCPFFLPDFNEKDDSVKNVLFMIDTSASMDTEQITACYSEILGAIAQFGGKLSGQLGFFDAVVVEPSPFESEEEFQIIRPQGGGGTSFHCIFDYVREHMDEPPVSIIILTDGYAPYPPEDATDGIPVLWIINNEQATPPWGKIARLPDDKCPQNGT